MSRSESHSRLRSSLHFEIKHREGVHTLEIRHDPCSGLNQGNMIVGKNVLRVRLLPDYRNEASKESMENFFWKKVREIGLSPHLVSLEFDDRELPIWNPPALFK